MGRCALELAQGPSRVALAWHFAGGSSPLGVTGEQRQLRAGLELQLSIQSSWAAHVLAFGTAVQTTSAAAQLETSSWM